MKIETFVAGGFYTNCYILSDELTGQSALIDAPYPSKRLIDAVSALKYDLKMILLTHRHIDHIWAVKKVKDLTGAKVYIHKLDECGLYSTELSLAAKFGFNLDEFFPMRADGVFEDEITSIKLGSLDINVMHTPGHTEGGVSYICEDTIFSGDTLFAGSVGRCDFPTGDNKELQNSLRRLYLLNGDYNVLSGHGEATTLDVERKTNSYMLEALTL